MDAEKAISVAKNYLLSRQLEFADCYSCGLVQDSQIDIWCNGLDDAVLPYRPSKLWRVDFEWELLPEDTISTGNSFAVFVDDETGNCGIFSFM